MITDEDIIKYTLQHLDGWEITTEDTSVVNESAYMSEEELQRNANKYISSDEILLEFEVNKSKYAESYNLPDIQIIDILLCQITAGALWQKYNIHVDNEDMEDNTPQHYGGKLLKDAHDQLKYFTPQKVIGMKNLE